MEQLSEIDLLSIWFQTQGYEDWLEEEHADSEKPAVYNEDVVEQILSVLLREAADWSNSRIDEFLDPDAGEY